VFVTCVDEATEEAANGILDDDPDVVDMLTDTLFFDVSA